MEACPLEIRRGLARHDRDTLALVARRANDAEGRTVAGRGEGAGVAVREDPRAVGHESGTGPSDGALGLDIGAMERERRLGHARRPRPRIPTTPTAQHRAPAI